jgi:hypothetical protein
MISSIIIVGIWTKYAKLLSLRNFRNIKLVRLWNCILPCLSKNSVSTELLDNEPSGYIKGVIFWQAEGLLASEGLCSKRLDNDFLLFYSIGCGNVLVI